MICKYYNIQAPNAKKVKKEGEKKEIQNEVAERAVAAQKRM